MSISQLSNYESWTVEEWNTYISSSVSSLHRERVAVKTKNSRCKDFFVEWRNTVSFLFASCLFYSPFVQFFRKQKWSWWNEIPITKKDKDCTSKKIGKIFLGALPIISLSSLSIYDDLQSLKNGPENIKAVLSVTKFSETENTGCCLIRPIHHDEWQKAGIDHLQIESTHDKGKIKIATAFIKANVESGRNIYIHCKYGKKRSPKIVAAYLTSRCNMTYEEARETILHARPQASLKTHL